MEKLNSAKTQIEQRYKRLNSGHRRPNFEYLSPDEIREIFSERLENKEDFIKKTDEELLSFYTEWYESNFPVEATNPKETENPTID